MRFFCCDKSERGFSCHCSGSAKAVARVKNSMDALTPDERLEVMREWCAYCGGESGGESGCQCWNDE